MIFDKYANLKYKYGNRHFWCRGYYVDTVGKNTKKIAEYIRTQLEEDIAEDQINRFFTKTWGMRSEQMAMTDTE